MKLSAKTVAGLGLAFFLGCAAAAMYHNTVDSTPAPEKGQAGEPAGAADSPRAPARIAAGGYSNRCATSSGICIISPPQRVGSRCTCPDKTKGTVVR